MTNKLTILFLFLLGANLYAQEGEPITLDWADRFHIFKENGADIRELIGNVRLRQGDVTLNCDHAVQYLQSNCARLIGNVIIEQQKMTINADYIFYDGNNRIADSDTSTILIDDKNSVLFAGRGLYYFNTTTAEFFDNIQIDDDSATIWAEHLVYNRTSRISNAHGNVLFKGKFTNAYLNGDTIMNDPNRDYTFVTGRPLLFQIDTVKAKVEEALTDTKMKYDTLFINSDTIHFYNAEPDSRVEFLGNVGLIRDNVMARAGLLIYRNTPEQLQLYNTPVVWMDSTQLHADSIIINIPEKQLNDIKAMSNSFAAMRDDSVHLDYINQIEGKDITISIDGDNINSILSSGQAKSLYFLASDSDSDIADRKGTDTVLMKFDSGELDKIFWLGATEGEAIPENIFQSKIIEYYLPSYRWRGDRPQKMYLRRKLPN